MVGLQGVSPTFFVQLVTVPPSPTVTHNPTPAMSWSQLTVATFQLQRVSPPAS